MFILWIIVGILIGLGFGYWTRTSRDEAIHDSWRARLVQAENTIDDLRANGPPPPGTGAAGEDRGLAILKEQLLKCQSERSAALAENDRLKARMTELEAGLSSGLGAPSPRTGSPRGVADGSRSAPLPGNAAALATATGIPAANPDFGKDDLKIIKGIGPKMEKLLHSLGIYTFAQIAGWTPDQSARVDVRMEGFRGRIARDNWVAQARDLT